jgi:hypothetical protein
MIDDILAGNVRIGLGHVCQMERPSGKADENGNTAPHGMTL